MKLDIEGEVWNIISCYAPQTGCAEYEKDHFWETIASEMQAVERSEQLVVAGDLNGHMGSDKIGYEEVHGGHGVRAPNEEGIKVLDFATAYQMRILNTSCRKRKNHPVTYSSGGRETQIDFIMLRKEHASECRNCQVLPSEAITTQHRTLIAYLVVKKTRQMRAAGRKRLRWWKLKDEETKEKFRRNLVERLSNIDEATTENVEQWWGEIAEQIKKYGEEICGRSTGKRAESAVREKKERLKIWKRTGEETDKVAYKTAKGKAKRVVARVKAEAIEGLTINWKLLKDGKRYICCKEPIRKEHIMPDTQCQKCNRGSFDEG